MILKSEDRPKGMSQLDWLWLNYKHYNVQNEASEIPSERIILTEQAITNLVRKATGGGITSLRFEENPDDTSTMRLIGQAVNGEVLTIVVMPKEEHIISFANRKVTQTDVDNGCGYVAGTDVLAITTNLGKVYMVSLADLDIQISGGDTDTVHTEVINGVVTANVKIDSNNNANSAVEIKNTNKGLYTQLKLDDSSTGVKLEVGPNGLKASIPVGGESTLPIEFSQLSMDEYLVLNPPVENTVYFITDKPFIYFNGMRYGVNILPGDYPIVSLIYDEDCMRLYYKKSDGSDIQALELGAVSAERNGMLTKEQYTEFLRLLNAIGSLTSVQDYVQQEVRNAAFSLEKGPEVNSKVPLILKDGNNNILSTVYLETEDYLSFAEQRAATTEDVINAAKKGVLIREGQSILILTLVSGDLVYVNLSGLVDAYSGDRTNTIQVSVADYKISANVIIPADEKILYESTEGLSARVAVKQNHNIITIYGKTDNPEDKLGEFALNDQLLSYTVLHNFDENMLNMYPPRQVDGEDYDSVENPVYFGYTYIVLTMGVDTGDLSTSYKYNLYLSMTKFLDEIVVSNDEDNILTKGSDGHLYTTLAWTEVL